MSRQGANRSSRRGTSYSRTGSNNSPSSSFDESGNRRLDQMLGSSSESVEESIYSSARGAATCLSQLITDMNEPHVNKHPMNLRRTKIEQQDDKHRPDPQWPPDRKIPLTNQSEPTDPPSSPSLSIRKIQTSEIVCRGSSPKNSPQENSPLLSGPDEFIDPFKASPSDVEPSKFSSDESLGADRKFSNASSNYEFENNVTLLSQDIQSPLNPCEEHRQNVGMASTSSLTAYPHVPLSSFPLKTSADDTDTHVTRLFEPDPYPSTVQQVSWQKRHHHQQQHHHQQHEIGWAQPPSMKPPKNENMSPMTKTITCTAFSSPPPKKRRFMTSSNTSVGDNNPNPAEAKHSSVFRSPAGNYPWNFSSKSPLFTKDSDVNLHGMSFGLDTPGRSKFDDLLPQTASFDAMPLPVHGEDARSPFNGLTSQSALEFASKFNLSRSCSMEESPVVNFAAHQYHPGQNPRYAIPSPYSSERRPQRLPRITSDHRTQTRQPPESFPPEFMSPPQPPLFQKNIHPPMALPQFASSKKVKMSPEPSSTPDFGNYPRPMMSHPPQFIPSTADRGGRIPLSRDRDLFSPGPFRVKIGNVGGLQQAEARRGMEGINSIMKEASNQSSYPSKSDVFSPIKKGGPTVSTMIPSRQDIQTPLKMQRPVSGPVVTGGIVGPHPNQGSATTNRSYPSMQTPRHPKFLSPSPHVTSSSGNKGSGKSASSTERNPCNCKKCKCLKLYCECFAAELYCDNCNCNDCSNTPEFDLLREKARKDTTAKNPNAFKKKISEVASPTSTSFSPHQGHNMGCRCKKSSCLMKYCECFQSDVFCAGKCKCSDCKNFHGSQALIDRRHKIKDSKGAEKAMRSSDELWKVGGSISEHQIDRVRLSVKTPAHQAPPPSHKQRHYFTPGDIPSYHPLVNNRMSHPITSHPTHQFIQHNTTGHGPMGYLPTGMKTTPGYMSSYRGPYSHIAGQGSMLTMGMKPPNQTPQLSTPRTPKSRRRFDYNPRHRADLNQRSPLFGSQIPISRGLALQIFSYLPNDAIYNASLVNREWCKISLDEELWQY